MREAERGIRFIAVDDHRDKEPVQRVPHVEAVGERGERRQNPRTVFRDVAAVESKPFGADPVRRLRIHGLEGALGAVRIFAELAVELVEHAKNDFRRDGDAQFMVGAGQELGICLLDPAFGLGAHDSQPLFRRAVAIALIDN